MKQIQSYSCKYEPLCKIQKWQFTLSHLGLQNFLTYYHFSTPNVQCKWLQRNQKEKDKYKYVATQEVLYFEALGYISAIILQTALNHVVQVMNVNSECQLQMLRYLLDVVDIDVMKVQIGRFSYFTIQRRNETNELSEIVPVK
ncbi:Hypothetical_protein [Hexamita inflata]|uniref:Hypothetical_protein n=1 Tax=Hexamita inflata TaxID=28002 RepID=A0AA86NPA9_9EUKA|nr:Hypothetical protein HINF_LOCUS10948 [Hexamita inflata]